MNWRVCRLKILREENGIEIAAERHELRFDPLQPRRGAQSGEHFGDQFLGDGRLLVLRGDEQAADQAFVIVENVESVTGRVAVLDGGISAQRARVDEFADQFDRGAIVPVKVLAPAADFFLEQGFEGSRMDLPKVERSAQEPR